MVNLTPSSQGNHTDGYDNGSKCLGYTLIDIVSCSEGGGDAGGDNYGDGTDGSTGNPNDQDGSNTGDNASGGGGGSGSGNSPTPNPIVSTPVVLTMAEQLSEFITLDDDYLETCINKPDNKEFGDQLRDYFLTQNNNPNAESFGLAAIEAKCGGGEVDLVNEVILDKSFKDNEKTKCVYDKLKNLSNTVFNDIINDHFDSSKNAHIRFRITTTPDGEDAFTKGSTNNGKSFFEIQLDPTVVANASTIEIALMIIHESIHAELLDRCVQLGIINAFNSDGDPNFTNTSITYTTYDSLFAILVYQYKNYNGGNTQWNHDLFTGLNYRTNMAQNLVDIHAGLNDPANDFLSNVNNDNMNFFGNFTLEQLMDYISWIGLEGTQDFINNIQNNPLEQTKKNYVENAARAKFTHECN